MEKLVLSDNDAGVRMPVASERSRRAVGQVQFWYTQTDPLVENLVGVNRLQIEVFGQEILTSS